MGYRLLQRMAADVAEFGYVESTPKQDGRNMVMVIGPHKKKAEAKAELRRKREEDDVHDDDHGDVPPNGVGVSDEIVVTAEVASEPATS
jgi:translation initiation factor IF-3